MDWLEEAALRAKRGNSLLFSKNSECLQDLAQLLSGRNHRETVLWALALAEGTVEELERRYPAEVRPRAALEAARDWAEGRIKMREAQRRILDCHALAGELEDAADIALCHAVGQACSVVHTAGHAMGYLIYELTAIVRREGLGSCRAAVEARLREYIQLLFNPDVSVEGYTGGWARFLR